MAEDGNQGTTVVVQKENVNQIQVQSSLEDSLLRLAVENNFDLDKLERLMAMKRENDKEKARNAFDAALTKFQEECPAIVKNKKGWDNKYQYADAGKIEEVIKTAKARNGFSHKYKYAQVPGPPPFEKEIWIQVTCVLSHIGGHSEETTLMGPPDKSENKDGKATKNPIQSSGSTVTYLERYTLKGALGLSTTQSDTDGVNPEQKNNNGGARKPKPTEKQYKVMISKVASGERTVASFEAACDLSPEQIEDLKSQVPKK